MSQSASAVTFNCVLTGSVDDRLQCCICFVTMLKPISLKCGHSGCQICMEEHVRKAVNPTCPICRAVINDGALSVNIALDNLTKEMPVWCVISGSDWTGVYGSAKSHYERCPKVKLRCEQDRCKHHLPREEMPAHKETCGKKRIRCSECRRAVKRESMEHHQASVYCPLKCETSLPRSHIFLHISMACQVPGCKAIKKRYNMREHNDHAAASHYRLQCAEIQRLRHLLNKGNPCNECKPPREDKVISFTWNIPGFLKLQGGEMPITSDILSMGKKKWRVLITKKMELAVQLLASC
ncbi:TNF receptor-associated factor 5-like [Montipora capricornis]|uniref:TNF receptor-associated factor 5-like n=1 Tax=Montipora capricornis TaxID=246305 RepID=UPI0035F132B1